MLIQSENYDIELQIVSKKDFSSEDELKDFADFIGKF